MLVLAFFGIVFAGVLGGAIGWGIVDTSCTEIAARRRSTARSDPRHDCAGAFVRRAALLAALVGAGIAAIGAGIVAGLMLRAQSEWRAHPPGPATPDGGEPEAARVSRSRSGGSPPRT